MAIYDPTYPPDDIFVKDLPAAIRQKGEQMREALEEILSLGVGGGTGAFISVRTNDAEIVSATSFSVEVEVLGFGELPPAEARVCVEYRVQGETEWSVSPLTTASSIGEYLITLTGLTTEVTYQFRAVGKSATNPLIVVRGEIGSVMLLDPTKVVGVQYTGEAVDGGWQLRQVRVDEGTGVMTATSLSEAYFNNHPSFVFEEYTDASGNVFRTIPIAYWWRGELPDTSNPGVNKWTMLISPTAQTLTISGVECTFEASPGAFKRSGTWMGQFYIGAYRGHDAGDGKMGSLEDSTIWINRSFTQHQTACAANGADYHMTSIQEFHEVCARLVVEKGSFTAWNADIRSDRNSAVYRGISDFGYAGQPMSEFFEGFKATSSGAQIWTQANSYASAGITGRTYTPNVKGFLNGPAFKHLFVVDQSIVDGNNIFPEYQSFACDQDSYCYGIFHDSSSGYGLFNFSISTLNGNQGYDAQHSYYCARLSKW